MSSSSSGGASGGSAGAPLGDQLLEAIAGAATARAAELIAAFHRAPSGWPITPAACLFAAVKTKQEVMVAKVLAAGAPTQFLLVQLPASDHAALKAAGLSVDGIQYLSPLVISVRQQSLEVARLLLAHGAPAQLAVAGLPLLLHFLEVAVPPPDSEPDPPISRSSGSEQPGSSSSSNVDGSSSSSRAPAPVVLPPVRDLEGQLNLLWLLLQHGADPLQPSLAPQQHTFLTACQSPVLLRLAVLHVRRQCQQGMRQLSEAEAQQLVAAAGRAFLGGF